ncbi:hypothetical protein HAX54_003205 [Datura stramonium]|uniref:Uncharacterized protein n=1 Tax=Datura stramonium TaxID=4076 RepID=A0ABS8WS04_DATST|nr:hypothetical protein [Datura stramonium]
MEQLMYGRNFTQDQTHDGESNELRTTDNEEQQNDESGNTNELVFILNCLYVSMLLKESVLKNDSHHEDRKSVVFFSIFSLNPRRASLSAYAQIGSGAASGSWPNKQKQQAKQKMPHTGGSKSIATLMDEKVENGIEPTRAQVFILTHKPRKDGRPLNEESAKTIDTINEKLSNSEGSNEQPPLSIA